MATAQMATPTPWRVSRARLSLMHVELDPRRLGQTALGLASTADYEAKLSSLLEGEEVFPFELPFDLTAGNRNSFWAGLLGPDYWHSGVADLTSRVIPLRVRPDVDIQLTVPLQHGLDIAAIRSECFVYPHAIVTIVNIEIDGDATITEAADWVAAMAHSDATVEGEETRLADLAGRVSNHARKFCNFDVSSPDLSDFRIFSVISGATNGRGPDDGIEWAALRGITTLRDDWKEFAGPVKGQLTLSWGTPKLALFNDDAVSYVLASNFKGKKSSNGCYHRNQLLLATHLFALMPLVTWGAAQIQTHNAPVEVDRLVPAAAKTVKRLRGRNSYRSALTAPLAKLLDPEDKASAVADMA